MCMLKIREQVKSQGMRVIEIGISHRSVDSIGDCPATKGIRSSMPHEEQEVLDLQTLPIQVHA